MPTLDLFGDWCRRLGARWLRATSGCGRPAPVMMLKSGRAGPGGARRRGGEHVGGTRLTPPPCRRARRTSYWPPSCCRVCAGWICGSTLKAPPDQLTSASSRSWLGSGVSGYPSDGRKSPAQRCWGPPVMPTGSRPRHRRGAGKLPRVPKRRAPGATSGLIRDRPAALAGCDQAACACQGAGTEREGFLAGACGSCRRVARRSSR